MTLTTIAHTKFIDRIYDILISDSEFKKTFGSNIIKGQPTNEMAMKTRIHHRGNNPIVSKKVTARGNPPSYLITLEYWIVIHQVRRTSVDTLQQAYTIATEVETIMQLELVTHNYLRLDKRFIGFKNTDKTCCGVYSRHKVIQWQPSTSPKVSLFCLCDPYINGLL